MDLSGWIPPEGWAILIMMVIICLLLGYIVTPWLIHHVHISFQ